MWDCVGKPCHQQGLRKLLEMVCQKQKKHKKMRNQHENKKLGKGEVMFSWCLLHRMGIMGNGAEKAWNEQFMLKWNKATDSGQWRICWGCDRVGIWPWMTLRHAQSSAKCEKLTYSYSSPKKKWCVTTLREFRPNRAGKSKSILEI